MLHGARTVEHLYNEHVWEQVLAIDNYEVRGL